jgi:hypothetical protein
MRAQCNVANVAMYEWLAQVLIGEGFACCLEAIGGVSEVETQTIANMVI